LDRIHLAVGVATMDDAATPERIASRFPAARRSAQPAWLVPALAVIPPALVVAATWLQPWVPADELLRDPLAVAALADPCCQAHFGFVSNLGVLVWTAAAAVCLFASLVLIGMAAPWSVFMLAYAGVFTGLFALDDMLMLHEYVLPAFGLTERVAYAAYGLAGFLYLLLFYRQLLSHLPALFLSACGCLGLSVVIDQVIHSDRPLRLLAEDGAKFFGLWMWALYHVDLSWRLCRGNPYRSLQRPATASGPGSTRP